MQLLTLIGVLLISFLNVVFSQTDSDLIGRWEHVKYPKPGTTFTFYNNGTFQGSYFLESNYECFRIQGTYTVNTKKSPRQIDLTFDLSNIGRRITVLGLYEFKTSSGKETLNMDFGCDFCYVSSNTSRPSSISSCAFSMYEYVDTPTTSDPNLVGNWAHSDSRNSSSITFGSDGSFSYYYDCGWEIVSYGGTYQVVDANRNPKWIDVRFGPPGDMKYYEQELYSIATVNGRKELTITTLGFCTPYTPPCGDCRPSQFWSHEVVTFIPGTPSTTGSTGTTGRGTTGGGGGTTGGGNCGPTMSCQQCTDACAMTCKYTGCALDLCNSDCKRYNCGMFCGGTKRLVTYEVYDF